MSKARWMRRVLGTVLGAVASIAIIGALEAVGGMLYPMPESFETIDRGELAAAMAAIPLPAKLLVVAGWLAGAFGGAWLALRIGDWAPAGWIVAALVLAGGIVNLVLLPHPLWMQIAAVAAPLVGVLLAQKTHHKPYKGEPLLG